MSKSMKATLTDLCQKEISTATDAELYTALLKLVPHLRVQARELPSCHLHIE